MSLLVAISILGGSGLWWCRRVLVDEEQYLRAVAPLATSPRFARLAGASVSTMARHRGGFRHGLSHRSARVLSFVTRHSMSTRHFNRVWMAGNRCTHRLHRRRQQSPLTISSLRLTVTMLSLAAMGTALRVGKQVRPELH
ncbi:MAG: hypothetical protein V9F03_02200 [Microthrixaceae bacterium]